MVNAAFAAMNERMTEAIARLQASRNDSEDEQHVALVEALEAASGPALGLLALRACLDPMFDAAPNGVSRMASLGDGTCVFVVVTKSGGDPHVPLENSLRARRQKGSR